MSQTIHNPILTGFHPDPCICRKGDDFYIANSSFQWWPGVPIHHSRDLANWELIGYALTRCSQLDMQRIPDSGGIWAPALSYCEHDGLFYLIYTNVNRPSRYAPIETPNYLVTAEDPRGPWSEPVFLNRSGFDPSIFHDDDGRSYLVNMHLGYRPGQPFFDGLLLQEYDRETLELTGPITNIFAGTDLGATEGPHIMKHGPYYYIICAEGGTGYHHALTMARSTTLLGPYEVHPENPIITALGSDSPIQKSGHGNLVETPSGEWYGVFLCGRPNKDKRCMLGRETAIERGAWGDDGWFRFDSRTPRIEIPAPNLPESPVDAPPVRDNFQAPSLACQWNTLRMPHGDEVSLADRAGYLRLYGMPHEIETNNRQALVARRIQHHRFDATTVMEYAPKNAWQRAGLVAMYCHTNYYWLRAAHDEEQGTVVELVKRLGPDLTLEGRIAAPWEQFFLRLEGRGDDWQFLAGADGEAWHPVGDVQDGSIISDEAAQEWGYSFTGGYVGLAAVDISLGRLEADFQWFDYQAC